MLDTKDIYVRIGQKLVEKGFYEVSTNEQKDLISEAFKNYIISKLNELGKGNLLSNNDINEISVSDLLSILSDAIPEKERYEVLRHFVHCLINICSNMQGFDILWWGEDDENLIENPIISFDDNGLLNELKTHDKTSYVKTFNLVYHTFMNEFMKDVPRK